MIEYEDKIEIDYRERLLITHPYNVPILLKRKKRKITSNGNVMYQGKHFSIDYKLAGKTVEVQEINENRNFLVYLNGVLLKTLNL
ncbi:MAG TPA: hypothetical protein ENI29_12570 [bacterium]|nr:hypothetical protein [bacterium]